MRKAAWILSLLTFVNPVLVAAESPHDSKQQMQAIEQELNRLRDENARIHSQMEALQQKLSDIQQQSDKKTADLEQRVKEARTTTSSRVSEALDSYWGDHRFLISGFGYAQYHVAGRNQENNFSARFEPLFLYRISDRLLFEASVEVELPDDAETGVNLEYAQFDYLLNRYMTIVGGKYLLPFGDFYERLEADWVNKLATRPLPVREEIGLLPFSEIGAQVRGGIPLTHDGVDLDYTLFVGNGPKFTSEKRGAVYEPTNNLDPNKNKAVGARIGFRPLPFSRNWGRWKIGASTYNGAWDDKGNLWVHAWGIDSVYQKELLELRAEYINMQRELASSTSEHRDGWYVQAAYKLSQVALPIVNRSELIFRYSQQHQPQSREDNPPTFLRGRQYTFGYDYWVTPSTVLKLEYDFDKPRGERENHEFYTKFVVGF